MKLVTGLKKLGTYKSDEKRKVVMSEGEWVES